MIDDDKEASVLTDMIVSIGLRGVAVDRDIRLRVVTPAAAAMLRLHHSVLGRHLASVRGLASQADLMDDVQQVLATGRDLERQVVFPAGEMMLRRCHPWRSREMVRGVVITFENDRGRAGPPPAALVGPPEAGWRQRMEALTARQREIMALVVAGHPSKRIAAELGISARTVENHRSGIMRRTGCRSLPELTRFALLTASDRHDGAAHQRPAGSVPGPACRPSVSPACAGR